jgi:hypothetical protein
LESDEREETKRKRIIILKKIKEDYRYECGMLE